MKKFKVISLLLLLMVLVISCRINVPIKEMIHARYAIKRGYEVKADKYDAENFNKSMELLYNSHNSLKKEDIDKAKKEAEESLKFATGAIEKSLPLLANDTLNEAMNIYKECESLYAEKFAPEDFSKADGLIKEAEKLKTEGQNWDSYLKSSEAIKAGSAAKTAALNKIPSLNEDIERLNKEREELESRNLSDDIKAMVNQAKTNLESAKENLTNNNIKKAVDNIAEAETNIKNAKLKAEKISAKEKIKSLRQEADALKKERGPDFASDDIEVVTSTLNEAETILDQDKTDEALQKISEAENLLKAAKEKTKKGIASQKIIAVEKLLKDTKEKDKENKFQNEIDNASNLITDGKTLYDNGSYDECINKVKEAESILNSLSVAREKDHLKREGTDIIEGEGTIYTVQYNRKMRDCLWRIALKTYKNARLWPLIYMANKDKIKDPDLIFPGQKFTIPPIPKKKEKKSENTNKDAIIENKKSLDIEEGGE